MTLAPSHTEEEQAELPIEAPQGAVRSLAVIGAQTSNLCVCAISPLAWTIQPVTDDVPLQHQATSRHKGPLRVKQRPSNCAFEQAAWSVSWWLVGPSGPAEAWAAAPGGNWGKRGFVPPRDMLSNNNSIMVDSLDFIFFNNISTTQRS